MAKVYKWIYIVLAAVSVVLLFMTVYAGRAGNTGVFQSAFTVVLFGVCFVMQIIGIFMARPELNVKKISFYVVHSGILVMLIGFFAYYVAGEKYYGNAYDSYLRLTENGREVFGFDYRIDNFETVLYEDTGMPKQYIAQISLQNNASLEVAERELRVNKPARYNGWKIFLISHSGGSAAVLLFKRDPGEYVTVLGMLMIMAGAAVMCLGKRRGLR